MSKSVRDELREFQSSLGDFRRLYQADGTISQDEQDHLDALAKRIADLQLVIDVDLDGEESSPTNGRPADSDSPLQDTNGQGQLSASPNENGKPHQHTTGGNAKPPIKVGQEIEIATKEFSKTISYGELKIAGSVKFAPTYIGGKPGPSTHQGGGQVIQTSKIKDGKRQGGAKMGASYQQIADREFWVLSFANLIVGAEGEWSGSEISAYGQIKFTLETPLFDTDIEIRPIIFKVKDGESPKIGAVEIKIKKTAFTVNIGGTPSPLYFEAKGSFDWDKKKVGQEVVEKIAKKKLEQEAKKQGVKALAGRAAATVIKRLAAVATAFEVGWIIGKLLNQFTDSDEAAAYVIDDIMGDFKDKYHKADTLGKMILIVKNKPRIVAALIAAGVVGVAVGIGDLVLFKVLKLDQRARDFKEALKAFMRLMESIPNLGDAAGDMILSTAIKLSVKLNPKNRSISDPGFDKLATAVFNRIQPVYKKAGGLNELISLKLYDVDVEPAVLKQVTELIIRKKLNLGGAFDLASPPEDLVSPLLEMGLQDFLRLMENNKLISYKKKIDDNLSMSSITQEMINEVFL